MTPEEKAVWMQSEYVGRKVRPRLGVYRRWQRRMPEIEKQIALAYEAAVARWAEDYPELAAKRRTK